MQSFNMNWRLINKLLTTFLLILLADRAISQTDIINKTLVVPDSNVLFVGVPNSIQLINYKNPFFEIRASNSILRATSNSFVYEISPARIGWDTIFILDDGHVLLKKVFRIDPIPAVQAKLGTLKTDEATQEEIVINSWIELFVPNCKCTTRFSVASFEVSFDGDDVPQNTIKIEGDRLTIAVRKMIMALKSGDTVYFDHIVAKNDDGKSIEVPGVSVSVR
jgi:hypothetical protein